MITARLPDDEQARLAAISRYRLDAPGREPAFNHAVQLAVQTFDVPISLVSIVGPDLQCFKGGHGLDADQTARDISFCSHAILGSEVMVVEDALTDPRFADNPLVAHAPHIRFYAGAPLRLSDGLVPGTLCLIDREPRHFSQDDRTTLERIAALVVDLIELRLESTMAAERHRVLDRMKDEFLAAASHELRTPITSILGSLGLLTTLSEPFPAKAKRLLQIAHDNSRRLARLVDDILDLSKLAGSDLALDMECLDVRNVLQECLDSTSGYAVSHGVQVTLGAVQDGLSFDGDSVRVQQVLANLVSNAVKFSDKGQTVLLHAEKSGNNVRLSVQDAGRGIPEEFRSRIFQRFEQADPSDGLVRGGTGLGLVIAQELVTRMGGKIDFASVLGEGTTFRVDFPAACPPYPDINEKITTPQ